MKYMIMIIILLFTFYQNIDAYLNPHQEIINVIPNNALSNEHDLVEMYSYGDGRLLDMTWQDNSLLMASTKGLFSYTDSLNSISDNRNKIWSTAKATFSSNHQIVLRNGITQEVQLWNANDGTLIETIDYIEQTDFFAIDSNNLLMITGSGGGQIKLYDLKTTLLKRSTQAGLIYGLELSPSGKYFAYFGTNIVTIYNIEQDRVVNYQADSSITDMVFDPVQDTLVIADYYNNIHLIEADTGISQIYSLPNFVIYEVDMTKNGTIVAISIEKNETLLIEDKLENAKRLSFSGTHVALNSDETKIALAQLDGTIQIFDIDSGTMDSEFGNFIYQIYNISFHPEQTQVGMAIWNEFGRYANKTDFIIWDFETGETYRIQEEGASVSTITYLDDTDIWLLGLINGQVSLYSENLENIATFWAYEDHSVYKMAFNEATQTLITLSSIGEFKLWDVSNLENIETSYQFEYRITDIAINQPDNLLIYTSGTSIVLWDIVTQTQISILPEDGQQAINNSQPPQPLNFWKQGMYAISLDEHYVYTISSDLFIPSRIQKWDLNQLELVSVIDIEELQIEDFIVDEDILIANSFLSTQQNGLVIMDLATMSQIPYVSINFASILAYADNAELLAIAGGSEIILFSIQF